MLDLAQLYTEYAPALRRAALRWVAPDDADDLCQDVWLRALTAAYDERGAA